MALFLIIFNTLLTKSVRKLSPTQGDYVRPDPIIFDTKEAVDPEVRSRSWWLVVLILSAACWAELIAAGVVVVGMM